MLFVNKLYVLSCRLSDYDNFQNPLLSRKLNFNDYFNFYNSSYYFQILIATWKIFFAQSGTPLISSQLWWRNVGILQFIWSVKFYLVILKNLYLTFKLQFGISIQHTLWRICSINIKILSNRILDLKTLFLSEHM